MLSPEKFREPYFRGLLYLPLKDSSEPFFINETYDVPTGRCELAVRNLEMPPIDMLSNEMRWQLGILMRYIATSFDAQGLDEREAIQICQVLDERIAQWMQKHSENVINFGVATFLDLYISIRRDLPATFVRWFRTKACEYVEGRVIAVPQKGPSPRAFDLEAHCAKMITLAQVAHLPSTVYRECERATWTPFNAPQPPWSPIICICVDGDDWVQADNDPFTQLRTEWLLLDMREPIRKCYERVQQRSLLDGVSGSLTHAGWRDTRTGSYGPIESQMYVPVLGTLQPLASDKKEVARMFHVISTLILLLAHPAVRFRKIRGTKKLSISLPDGMSVNKLVFDVQKNSKESKRRAP